MLFYSTNRKSPTVTFSEAIRQGQPPDRGLYMPERIPHISRSDLERLRSLTYPELASALSALWIGDEFDKEILQHICTEAYTWEVPLRRISDDFSVLELWHGPTLAFKDFAAQWSARVLTSFLGAGDTLTILVATSGDTGSAVAAGYHNLPGVRVVILYPAGQVSHIQEQQLTTFGGNVTTLEVSGSFDDCQRMVKEIFADEDVRRRISITSANSINIARLIPQSFYYVWAYLRSGSADSRPFIFSIPSGNVGNLTAGLLARQMGIPARFIAASNANTTVTEFITTGAYQPRASLRTLSNAMDVGAPSNIARVFALYSTVPDQPVSPNHVDLAALRRDVWSTSVDDATTRAVIKEVYEHNGYVIDPHTAVGWEAVKWYRAQLSSSPDGPVILVSTAHPAKFIEIMEEVLGKDIIDIPPQLRAVMDKEKKSVLIAAEYRALKEIILAA